MKWVYALFVKHHHCYSDKRGEFVHDGVRVVVMTCNKCGLEKVHTFPEKG